MILGGAAKIAELADQTMKRSRGAVTSSELIQACEEGEKKAVAILLRGGQCDVDWQDHKGMSPLIAACKGGHLEVARLLLEHGASVDAKSRISSDTPLIYATICGHLPLVELLVEKGADVNANHRATQCTPLLLASLKGNRKMVDYLLSHSADIHAVECNGSNALLLACSKGHTETARVLMDRGCGMKKTNGLSALMLASLNGRVDTVELLLAEGAEVNMTDNTYNAHALHVASQNGRTEVVRLLLDKSAKVNFQAKDGFSALMLASENGHADTVELLLAEGAEVNMTDNTFNAHALHMASQNGHTEVVRQLLDKSAKVNFQAKDGFSALMMASQNGHADTVELLLAEGAEVNMVNNYRCSALHVASCNGHTEVVRLLLDKSAKVNLQSKDGVSALMLASQNGHADTVELLLAEGVEVSVQANNGRSAVHCASFGGQVQVLQLLCADMNTDINCQDAYGITPLMLASAKGHSVVVDVLLDHSASTDILSVREETALSLAIRNGHHKIIESLTGQKLANSNVSLTGEKPADSNIVSLREQKLGNMSTDFGTNITLPQTTLAQNEAAMFAPDLGLSSSCASNDYYTPQPPSRFSCSEANSYSFPTPPFGALNRPRPMFGGIQSSVHSSILSTHHYSQSQATVGQPFQQSLQTLSYPMSQCPNLCDFFGALLPVKDDWKKIGTLLGCNFATLNDIQRRERNNASCLMEMLAERQKIHEPPLSWGLIISAVQPLNSLVAENIISAVNQLNPFKAENIEKKNCRKAPL